MLIIIFFATAAAKLIVSIICTQLNLGHLAAGAMQLRTGGHQFELPAIKYEFNKRNFIVRSLLVMYDLCVFTCIILIIVFHCTHVRMSYVLNSYLLTYLLNNDGNLFSTQPIYYQQIYLQNSSRLKLSTLPPPQ